MTSRSYSRAARVTALLLAALAVLTSACSVASEGIEIANTRPIRSSATTTDGGVAPVSNSSAEDASIATNELGEQLLQRVIQGTYESSDCDLVDPELLPVEPECGWLIRPLHGGVDIEDIELPVVIFRSTAAEPAAEPLVYLHGGPSDGILQYFSDPLGASIIFDLVVQQFIDSRDVILFDQRGTGLAEPDLRCDSPYQWFNYRDEDPETYVSRTAGTCAFDLFQDGIRLDQFSRQSSADDVMVLARELGHEQIDLHGSSWGGILGYTVMQLHPDVVRSAVLDSPLSIGTDLTGSMPGSFYEAMQGVQANCERSPGCTDRHGNIVDRYVRVFESLDTSPQQLLLGGEFPVWLTADELSYLMFGLLYSPEAIAIIPDMLLDLENGDVTLVEELAWEYGWGWGIDFTFLTYMCTDIVSASSAEQVDAQQIGIEAFDRVDDAPDGRGHTAQAICDRMKVRQPAAPAMREPTPSTPMIVFSGSMDPITPFSSGKDIVDGVPNGTFVGFDDLSHGVTHEPCAAAIANEFLLDPMGALDTTCAESENRDSFAFIEAAQSLGN